MAGAGHRGDPDRNCADLADWTAEVLPDAEAHAITPGICAWGFTWQAQP